MHLEQKKTLWKSLELALEIARIGFWKSLGLAVEIAPMVILVTFGPYPPGRPKSTTKYQRPIKAFFVRTCTSLQRTAGYNVAFSIDSERFLAPKWLFVSILALK